MRKGSAWWHPAHAAAGEVKPFGYKQRQPDGSNTSRRRNIRDLIDAGEFRELHICHKAKCGCCSYIGTSTEDLSAHMATCTAEEDCPHNKRCPTTPGNHMSHGGCLFSSGLRITVDPDDPNNPQNIRADWQHTADYVIS